MLLGSLGYLTRRSALAQHGFNAGKTKQDPAVIRHRLVGQEVFAIRRRSKLSRSTRRSCANSQSDPSRNRTQIYESELVFSVFSSLRLSRFLLEELVGAHRSERG